jgi:hypothetical protein
MSRLLGIPQTLSIRRLAYPSNSPAGYGATSKPLQWLIALLIVLPCTSASFMVHTPAEVTTLGLGQGTNYNWHKSLGSSPFQSCSRLANG